MNLRRRAIAALSLAMSFTPLAQARGSFDIQVLRTVHVERFKCQDLIVSVETRLIKDCFAFAGTRGQSVCLEYSEPTERTYLVIRKEGDRVIADSPTRSFDNGNRLVGLRRDVITSPENINVLIFDKAKRLLDVTDFGLPTADVQEDSVELKGRGSRSLECQPLKP